MNADTYLKFHKKIEEVFDLAVKNNDREMLLALKLHEDLAKKKGTSFEEEILIIWLGKNESH